MKHTSSNAWSMPVAMHPHCLGHALQLQHQIQIKNYQTFRVGVLRGLAPARCAHEARGRPEVHAMEEPHDIQG
jgi:hypothetical protein